MLIAAVMMIENSCTPSRQAETFQAQVDQAPPEKQPPDWEETKALMARKAPAIGEPAPDFTLPRLDGDGEITRSKLPPGKPQVLVFGSFT